MLPDLSGPAPHEAITYGHPLKPDPAGGLLGSALAFFLGIPPCLVVGTSQAHVEAHETEGQLGCPVAAA